MLEIYGSPAEPVTEGIPIDLLILDPSESESECRTGRGRMPRQGARGAGLKGTAWPAVESLAGSREETDGHDHDLQEAASSPSGDPSGLV